ncbi:MAG: transposase [Saprospiraceae bacterium]|nr:transposase [Saprospiraceae bacterium]
MGWISINHELNYKDDHLGDGGYQWVYHSPEERLLFFDYHKGRDIEGPKTILERYTGLLQSDG